MRPRGRWQPLLRSWLVAAGLLTGSGCLSILHPIESHRADYAPICQEIPRCSKDHVYIFQIHGLDPLDYANLHGLNDHLRSLGFRKTYHGQLYHTSHFGREIRRIHQEDPDARFVLLGFSFGANMVRSLAHAAKAEGISIDLLVYLGGNTLKDIPRDRPENCAKIVNILAKGCIWNGANIEGAENVDLPDAYHFGSPTHPYTLQLMTRELAVVAAAVPVAAARPHPMPTVQEEPTPRPITEPDPTVRDEWDFLKPATTLRELSSPPRRSEPAASPPRGENVVGK